MPSTAVKLLALLSVCACEQSFVPTIVPKDAEFTLVCASGCGQEGRENGIIIDVTFMESYSRQISLCCSQHKPLLAQLKTVRDFWCDGLDVPDKQIADITVSTTVSDATKKRGATLDQGSGYVAFNCGEWLDDLIAKLDKSRCCNTK